MLRQQQLLKRVSRSMYLSFSVMPHSVQNIIGLAYMLCRAADTIADSTILPVPERCRFLSRYKAIFQHFPFDPARDADLPSDAAALEFTTVQGDQQLMKNLALCFKSFGEQPLADQALISRVVCAVINGMEIDLKVFADDSSPQSLQKHSEFETYLQLIGGEPGRFWSDTTLAHINLLPIEGRNRWVESGVVFGMGLQMVNILRDLPVDLKRGRCYVPQDLLDRHQLALLEITPPPIQRDKDGNPLPATLQPVSQSAEDRFRMLYVDLIEVARKRLLMGVDYIEKIPKKYWGLRAAVVWPMMIGLETLKRLQEAPSILNSKHRVKVKRWEIYRLLATTAPLMMSQSWIKRKARSLQ